MKPSLRYRWQKLFTGRARTWLLMVPLHMAAFLALYVAAERMMEAGYSESTTETSRMLMEQAVAQLAVVSDDPVDDEARRRMLDLFLATNQSMQLALLDPEGQPLSPAYEDSERARRSVEKVLSGRVLEEYWLEETDSGPRMRGFRRIVSVGRCVECHLPGEVLGVATLSLDVTGSLRRIQEHVLRNLILLILVWAGIFGLMTALVRRSVKRSAEALVADLEAVEAGERDPEEEAELVLDSGSEALHRSLRAFLHRQRRREADVALKLERTDQLASLGGLAAGLAHEIRNPLAGIKGALEILREDTGEEFTGKLSDEMLRELERVNKTLESLLASARPSPPNLVTASVDEVLEEVQLLMEPGLRRKNIHLGVEAEGGALEARIDVGKIRQVLLNLIDNAAAAIGTDGVITLRAAEFPQGGGVILTVEDNGPGVPPDVVPRMFEPFFTTKFGGTGLGLAISQSLVEQHGGSVEVESVAGEGTTIFLFLPEGGADHGDTEARSATGDSSEVEAADESAPSAEPHASESAEAEDQE